MIETDNLLIEMHSQPLASAAPEPTLSAMMRKLLIFLLVLLLAGAALIVFLGWAEQRPRVHYLSDLRSELISEPPPQGVHGNLLAIRPQLFPLDYQSPAHLRLKLAAALDHARTGGLLNRKTLVVLPEHIGTWLLATGEKAEFYRARDRVEVRNWLLLGNPVLALEVLLQNLDADRLDEALLRMKAERMAEDYQTLFGGLARDYGITLLAGSILLPEPRIEAGRLKSGDGPLRTISLVFGPDGHIVGKPYREDWPWEWRTSEVQDVRVAGLHYRVERNWQPGWPQSQVQLPDGRSSAPLFLRGRLSWPIGGAPRSVELTPQQAPQASQAPGSHLLNQWVMP
jgi:hypothetical protein